MGLLDGDLQRSIYEGFKGMLLSGVLRRSTAPESATLDERGDPQDSGAEPNIPIEGFTDQYSAFTRAQPGFPQTDLKVCIFGGSAPDLQPTAHDLVRWDYKTGARWFRLRKGPPGIRVDPATALWECQAYEVDAPQ